MKNSITPRAVNFTEFKLIIKVLIKLKRVLKVSKNKLKLIIDEESYT